MALQLRRGETRSFGKMIATSFAVMAFVLQPLVSLNIPSVFALGPTTLYVDASAGTVGANCSQTTPCKTISEAISSASGGDTIKVAPGTYAGNLTINKKLALRGDNLSAIIAGRVTFGTGSDGSQLYGFTVSTTGLDYSVGITNVNDVTISNNTLAHTSAAGVSAKAVYIGDGNNSNVTVTNNNIRAVSSDKGAYGILVNKNTFSGLRITNNYIKTLVGGWTHAIGLEGNTPGAVVTNNHISGLSTINGSPDLFSVFFEDNSAANTVTITGDYNGKPVTNSASDVFVDGAWVGYPSNVEVLSADGTYRYVGQNAFATLKDAIAGVANGGVVKVAGTQVVTDTIVVNKKVDLEAQPGAVIETSGTKQALTFLAAGSTLNGFTVTKTDNNSQNIIGIQGADTTISNNEFSGQYYLVTNTNTARALDVSTTTGLNVTGNTFNNLRQPAYINNKVSGVIANNYLNQTRGWVVVSDTHLTFTGNSWGQNAVDIAFISQDGSANNYTCEVMTQIQSDNSNAVIDNQVLGQPCAPTNGQPNNSYKTTNDFYFTWDEPAHNSHIGNGSLTYEFQSDTNSAFTAPWDSITQGNNEQKNLTSPAIHSTGAPAGTYYWRVRAIDADGNKSEWSDTWNMTIDMTAPAAPVIKTPKARQWFKTTPIVDSWSAVTDPSGVHYQIAYLYDDGHTFGNSTCQGETIDGKTLSGCRDTTVTSRNHAPSVNEQGGVTVWVRAVDGAGNKSAWSSPVHYYYDATNPVTNIVAPTGLVGNSFTVSGDAHDNLSLNRVYVQLVNRQTGKRYGGTTLNLIPNGINPNGVDAHWSVDFDAHALGLPDGEYAATVSATDMAGNTFSTGWTANFTVDSSAPRLAITTYTVNGDGTYTVAGTTDDNNADVIVSVGVKNITVTPVNGHWSANIGAIADGTYAVLATTTDAAGNTIQISQRHTFSTPISQAEQSQGVLPKTPNGTAPAVAAQFFGAAATPAGQAVLGTTSDNGATDQAVKGASTTRNDTKSNDTKTNGFAWYWWLIAAAVAAFLWWLIAAARRRKQAE